MLAQVSRQILSGNIKLEEFLDPRIRQIEPGIAKLALGCVVGILPFPGPDETRKPRDGLFIEASRLTDFARRRPPAISNHIRGHRGATCAVALINMLNHSFALIAARQIEINVRPLAALFRKKSLEQ